MPTVNVQAELSTEKLLEAAEQLGPAELEHLVSSLVQLQARRRYPNLSKAETELLLKINDGLPQHTHQRYWELIRKREDESLTPAEYEELLRLSDEREVKHAERLEAVAQLAHIRGTTLRQLMDELDIKPYSDE